MMIALACLVLLAEPAKDFPEELQARARYATVRVVNRTSRTEGSGAVVGQSGPFVYVLTAAHVVTKAEKLEVHTFSADSYPKADKVYDSAEVVARSRDAADLALVRIPTRDRPPAALRICPPDLVPAKGFPALSVGCNDGKAPTSQAEEASGKKQVRRPDQTEDATCWEVSRKPGPGRSGGPLLDARGHLVGVCSGAADSGGYYSHAEAIHAFLKANAYRWLYDDR
jgi:hypothetical protein